MAWAFMAAKHEPSLRARAMRFLARREHSRAELRRKLAAKASEGDNLDVLLDDLAQRGWLSDARFAEQAARAKARRFGPLKLAHFLKGRGIDGDAIATGLAAAGADGASSIEAVWRGKYRAPPAGERDRARQVRFLQQRGFPLGEVVRFLKTMEELP